MLLAMACFPFPGGVILDYIPVYRHFPHQLYLDRVHLLVTVTYATVDTGVQISL